MAETEYPNRTVYQRADKKWGWTLYASNGKKIATDGGQGYENEAEAKRMADKIVGGEFKDAKRYRSPLKKAT